MGKSKNKLLIILMVAVLAATACGLLLSACAEEPVTVVLDANGGTFTGGAAEVEVNNVKPGTSLDLSSYAPTREGYEFSQWVDDMGTPVVAGQPFIVPISARPGSKVKLTAQWSGEEDESLGALETLTSILDAMTTGSNLHSEYSTTLTVPDKATGGSTQYSIDFKSNVKRGTAGQGEYDYDLGLVIRNVTENKGLIGLYVTDQYGIPGGLYIDTDPDDETGSVFLLEDFNFDYILALAEQLHVKLPETLSGLINIGGMPIDILSIVLDAALGGVGYEEVDADGNTVYTMELHPGALGQLGTSLGGLLGMLGSLVPALASIDLMPIFDYLAEVVPTSTFTLKGTVDPNGNLISLASSFVNEDTGEVLYEIDGGSISVTDRNDADANQSVVPAKVQHYNNTYSFGHIQMSAGVSLSTLSAPGEMVDIAQIIGIFAPGVLPEGVLMLKADLGYRLDLAIDLDIAQKPYSPGEEEVEDESVISIEIKDSKNNDAVVAGVYYRQGYIYVNIGQIVSGITGADIWNGKGFKIPFDLPSMIGAIKEVAIEAIDGFFGTDHGMITGDTKLEGLNGDTSIVTSLAMAQDGNVYISSDIVGLFTTIFSVLKIEGADRWVQITEGADYDTLSVTINKELIDSVLTAISGFGVDVSGVNIPDFGTGTISVSSGSSGLRDLTIGLDCNGAQLQIALDKLELVKPIEKGDPTFADYVDGVIGDTQYTSNLNDLIVSTLAAGLEGSVGLDVSFKEGIYNIGDLLAVFGLDLGDLKVDVQTDAELDLSLNVGIAIDETDYGKSSLYLQLDANSNFTLSNDTDDYIIKKGKVLGVYLHDNKIIVDVSGLNILGIDLPVYKISSEKFDAGQLIASLLANIPDNDLAIDLSGLIASLTGEEQAAVESAVAALNGGSGTVVRSSARADNTDLIKITVKNDLLSVTATLTAVFNLLGSIGLNIDFDASRFLQGDAMIDVEFTDSKLTAGISGDLLLPEGGDSSGLNANITLDLNGGWSIGGEGLADEIALTVEENLPEGWDSADDALLDGLLDTLFNSTLELSLTVPNGSVAIANLLGEVFALIPDMNVDLISMLESLDLGIVSEKVKLAIRAQLYKTDNEQLPLIKLGIAIDDGDPGTAEEPVVEVMLTQQDILYINLSYFGLGKYQVKDVGLMGMLDDLIKQLSEDLSLGTLLGGLIDFSSGLGFKAYKTGESVTLRWNKYGAASSVYYKVYAGKDAKNGTLIADTGAKDQSALAQAAFDSASGVWTLTHSAPADNYYIQVYTKLDAKDQVMFDAVAEADPYKADAPTASYQTENAVTFTWQAFNPFGAAESYELYGADGKLVTALTGASYDASTFTYTLTVDLTGKAAQTFSIYVNGTQRFPDITPVKTDAPVQEEQTITVSISEAANTATWARVSGAAYYMVEFIGSDGKQLWEPSRVTDTGRAFVTFMWGGTYTGYTINVSAYGKDGGEPIATGSSQASVGGDIISTIAPLLSALSIKGNLISLNLTRELLGDLIASLTGGATITLVDVRVTKLDIFKGSVDLTIGIYEDASVEDEQGYDINGSLTLSRTGDTKPDVDKGEANDYSEYKEINLLYGAGLTKSVIGILSDGISLEADLTIDVEAGAYNVSKIIGPFLPDDIAEYLGDSLTWTVGSNGVPAKIAATLGVYAAFNEEDLSDSGFMVRIAFPEGVSLSADDTQPGNVVAGNGFIIKKNSAITIAVSQNTLVVDLSAITVLGITLPVYKVEKFDLAGFVVGYLTQLEDTVANMYNDGNGMRYLEEESTVTADESGVNFTIAFDYIGNDMEFETVYFDKDAAEGGKEVLLEDVDDDEYNKETTTHKIIGSYNVQAAAGDYIAVYALDKLGNRYDCLKLTATGDPVVFAPVVSGVQAQAFADNDRFENYINIDPTKLQVLVTSQAVFSLLSQVVPDIPASVSSMEFDVEIGLGTPEGESEKAIWVNLDGTFDNKSVSLGLKAGIGIGGQIDGVSIPKFIDNAYAALPVSDKDTEYPTKLISGILDEVLSSKLTLSITAAAAESVGFDLLGVARQLVSGVVNLGDTALTLIAEESGEPVSIDLELALDGKMGEGDVDLNMISLKLNYVTKSKSTTLMGIYVYNKSLWLDLSGMGMGAVEVAATDIIDNLTAYLGGLIDGLKVGDTGLNIDLAGLLDLIAEGGTYPYGDALTPVQSVSGAEGDTAAEDEGMSESTKNIIKAIVSMVSVEYANIKLTVTNNIINELLSLVDSMSMTLNAEASGYLDIFAGKGKIVATIKDGVDASAKEMTLTLGLKVSKTEAGAAAALGGYIDGLAPVQIDLSKMEHSVVTLLNSLDMSLDLNLTAAGGTTDIWAVLAPILKTVLTMNNQNVKDALEAIEKNGVDWTIDKSNIKLSLTLAADLKETAEGALDLEQSTLVVGIIADTDTPLVLGASGADNKPILDAGEGIYVTIYNGNLYVDLSQVELLGMEFPVLKVENFDMMEYLADIVKIAAEKVEELLGKLPESKQGAAMLALANGTQTPAGDEGGGASLVLDSDLTLSVAMEAITKILKDTSIIDLTGLNDLPWEVQLTTAAGKGNQLKLSLNNTQDLEGSSYEGTGLEADLTLSAGFRTRVEKDDTDLRNKLIKYARGEGENAQTVEDRFADKSADLINEVINTVLRSRITLELGAGSNGETFDLRYALNGLLEMLHMSDKDSDKYFDPDKYFNIDTSQGVKYRLDLVLDGNAENLAALNAYIGIEMTSAVAPTDAEWETVIGIYLDDGDIYLDLSAIRNGALGGGVLQVTGSSIMDLAARTIENLLSGVNLDLNKLINLSYDPNWTDPNKDTEKSGNVQTGTFAPALTVNPLPIGTLVEHLIKLVSLENLGVVLKAQTDALQALTKDLFGTAIDFVEAEGGLLLVDGRLDLDVNVSNAAVGSSEATKVYTLGATLDISTGYDIADKINAIKEKPPATVIDLTSGATLSESIVGILGNLALDLKVNINLPGGVFGIGDLLNSFGIVEGGLTDSNGLDLIFEPLYVGADETVTTGGMQLGLNLSLKMALDYNDPVNTLAMLKISFDRDMIMGTTADGGNKVLFNAGTDFLTLIIDGTDLYIDLSDIRLLGLSMPKYHSTNFDISSFVTYVLDNALENTDVVIYGNMYVGCEVNNGNAVFTWSPVSGADSYEVSYADVDGEIQTVSGITLQKGEEKLTFTVPVAQLPEVYELTVLAKDADGTPIKSGTGTNSFSMTATSDMQDDKQGYTVSWNRVPGADQYYIYADNVLYSQITALSVFVEAPVTEVKVVPYKEGAPIQGVVGLIKTGGRVQQTSLAPENAGATTTLRDPWELTENEAMLIGVTQNDIAAIVSFTAVEAFLKLFGMEADLDNYNAMIDLIITRDPENEAWMQLHFVGELDEDMYYKGAKTEGTVSISGVELGGTPGWRDEVRTEAADIAKGAADAGSMLIEGIIEQVLNLSAHLELKVDPESSDALNIGAVLAYIFAQTNVDLDLGDIMLELTGLNVGIDLNLAIDPDDHNNSKATVEISDAGKGEKLIGIYLNGYEVVLDLGGISLGRFAVTDSTLPDLIYGVVDDLLNTISNIDIDLDTIVDTLYGLIDEAFGVTSSDDSVQTNSLASIPQLGVSGALSGYGFTKQGDVYVSVSAGADDTTTFTWSRYSGASHYVVELYNGYDNSKTNLIREALRDTVSSIDGAVMTDDGTLVLPSNITTVRVLTSVLNNIGLISDAESKYNGVEFPAYYVFVVRAGRYDAASQTFTPANIGGNEVYASTTNNTLLKTIMGMIKIRNGAIEVDARALMVDKLLRGVLGVAFDWANAKVSAEIVAGSAQIDINISDGTPGEYVATESTATPKLEGTVLTYTWQLTEEQAQAASFTFELRERAGDTAEYGHYLVLNSADDASAWTLPTQENNWKLTLTVDTAAVGNEWLNEVNRVPGETRTNLEMAVAGALPLRVTANYSVETVNITGSMQLGSDGAAKAEAALTGGADPVYVNGALAQNIQNISLMDNASLLDSVKELMDGFRLGAELAIYIDEGKYDMGALISDILVAAGVGMEGLDEIQNVYWTITAPFVFNLRLELLLEMGSAEDMRIALTLKSDGLEIDGNNAINPGTLIGLYYKNGQVLLDLTNFKIAGITLPAYTLELELFDLVDGMLEDLISGLDISAVSGGFKATADKDGVTVTGDMERYAQFEVIFNEQESGVTKANAEGGVKFAAPEADKAYTAVVKAYNADGKLMGISNVSFDPEEQKSEAQQGKVQGVSLAPEDGTSALTQKDAIVLGISSEEIALRAAFGAVATLLSTALSGNETVATVAGVLELLDLNAGVRMAKDQDLTLSLYGLLNWEHITAEDSEYQAKTVEVDREKVKYLSGVQGGTGAATTVAYSFSPIAGATSYTAKLYNSADVPVGGTPTGTPIVENGEIRNGAVYFESENITVDDAASGGYTAIIEANVDAPVNMQLSLGTSQLLGVDKSQIASQLDALLGENGSVNFDERVEAYQSKLLTGLVDTLLNTHISLEIDLAMLEGALGSDDVQMVAGKVSVSDLVLSIAGDIIVSAGLSIEDIIGSIDLTLDVDVSTLILDISMNLDLEHPANSSLMVQACSLINGVRDVLIGLYVYPDRNNENVPLLTLDLRALGLRAYTLQNFDYIVNLQNMLREALLGDGEEEGLLGNYDIDLEQTIKDLLNPPADEPNGEENTPNGPVQAPAPEAPEEEQLPSISIKARNDADADTTTFTWGAMEGVDHYELIFTDAKGNSLTKEDGTTYDVQNVSGTSYTLQGRILQLYNVKVVAHTDTHEALAEGSRQMNGAIASVINAVSMENTIIGLEVTPQIVNNLLAAIAPDISINTDPINVGASVDIFNGDASAEIDLTLKYEAPQEDVTFRLGARLGLGMAEELYSLDPSVTTPISEVLAELGTDVDTINFGASSEDAGVDAARITQALIDALNTTQVSADLLVEFDAGTYDVGAMLSEMGIEALQDVSLMWTFDTDQSIALTLTLGMYVDTNGLRGDGTWFLLDIKAKNEIKLGNVVVNNSNMGTPYTIPAGESIISIYGKETYGSVGTVYVDLSGISLLGFDMPVISAEYAFTDMLINEFYDIIASIMDLGQYLEAEYAVEPDGDMTFTWGEVTLGTAQAAPEVSYEVSVVGVTSTGVRDTVYTGVLGGTSLTVAAAQLAEYTSFEVSVSAYFDNNGAKRVLAERTTMIEPSKQSEVMLEYVTPEDIYAQEGNASLARVENVTFEYTGSGVGSVSWAAYPGALKYKVSVRRVSDGGLLKGTSDYLVHAVEGKETYSSGVTGLFAALDAFDATHPMMGAEYDYGYIISVYAYTDEKVADVDNVAGLETFSPAAVGAVNTFTDMNVWFAPLASEYLGGTTGRYYVGWGKVSGADSYTVLPYRVANELANGVMTTKYPLVGAKDSSGVGFTVDDLKLGKDELGNDELSFGYYNVTYTREYYVEVVAYDEHGNLIARGEIVAGLGKITDEPTLVPVSSIALVLDSERFGLEVQLSAVLAILEGVGVDLPVDLRGLDVSAALGLDTTLDKAAGSSDKISVAQDADGNTDVDGFMLQALSNGEHTLTVTYTNSGGVQTSKTSVFTWTDGVVSNVSGDMPITAAGFVQQSMRRNGDYEIELSGATVANARFVTSRTINLGIYGNVMRPVEVPSGSSGEAYSLTVSNAENSTIGVTENGRKLFWQPVAKAKEYRLNIVKTVDGETQADETFTLTSFVQEVDFTEAGVYTVTVVAIGADGAELSTGRQSAVVTVKGESHLNIAISIPYESVVVGASDEAGTFAQLQEAIDKKIAGIDGSKNYETLMEMVHAYLADFSVSLDLNMETFTSEFNLQTIINSILGAIGVTTEIGAPIYINTDDISGMGVSLSVDWHLDWVTPSNSYASIELTYNGMYSGEKVTNVMLGAYLSEGSVYVDLTGLGLFGIKLQAGTLYSFLTEMIVDTINGLFSGIQSDIVQDGDINFSDAITMLLGEYPTLDLVQIVENRAGVQGAALADEGAAMAAEESAAGDTDVTGIITALLNAVSLNSTNIFLNAGTAILDKVTSTLLGIKLGLDADLQAQLPLLDGNIIASLRLDNVTFEATLDIEAMNQPEAPKLNDVDFLNLNAESSGAEFAMDLLSKLPLNLTIELANATMDSSAYRGVSVSSDWLGHATYPAGTRIGIEVVNTNGKSYNGSTYDLANSFTADAGDIVVTIASTNEAEQNSTGADGGHLQYLLVVHIDVSAGQISVKLCERAIVLQIWASNLFGMVVEVDLGAGITAASGVIDVGAIAGIDAIPLNINIPLDLASTLGDLFQGLLDTLNNLGQSDGSTGGSTGGNTSSGTGETVDPYKITTAHKNGGQALDGEGYKVSFNAIINETAWNEDGAPTAWAEAYDRYFVVVSRADGSIVDRVEVTANGYTSQQGGRYTAEMVQNYYSTYTISIVGEADPTGFAAAFADLDIWKLLGGGQVKGDYNSSGEFVPSDGGSVITTTGGIYMNLNSTGEMNLTIRFDPYEINKAVDALFGSIIGAKSALDLTTVSLGGSGSFGINYLQFMWWDRAGMSYYRLSGEPKGNKGGINNDDHQDAHDTKAASDPTSTLDSLESQLRGLLADLLDQMGLSVNTMGAKLSGSFLRGRSDSLVWARWNDSPWGATPILLSIFMKFIPISIWNEAELNVNMTNGVLTNISFLGQDTGDAVLRYNENSGHNDVYVYYAQTLYSPNTEGRYGHSSYGMQSNWTYNPYNYQVGTNVDMSQYDDSLAPATLKIPYKWNNSEAARTDVAYKVYTYAIPYGSVDETSDYYFQDVPVLGGTGSKASGGERGYGGRNPNAASSTVLYRRGDVKGADGEYTHGENQWTKVNNRGSDGMNGSTQFTLESYTRIEIYNTGKNVNSENAGLGNVYNNGVVSWGNLPNRIVFDQYKMGWNKTAAEYLMDAYFGNTYTARWQKGTGFARANVTFSVNNTSTKNGLSGFQTALESALGDADRGGSFTVTATANFGNGVEASMQIIIEKCDIVNPTSDPSALPGKDEYKELDAWTLYYYDELPDYIIMTTNRDERKRYSVTTDENAFNRGEADALLTGYQTDSAGSAQGDEVKATVKFRNNKTAVLPITYLDSTLVDPTVSVDMNTLNNEWLEDGTYEEAIDKIRRAIESVVIQYADGNVLTNSSRISWGGQPEISLQTQLEGTKYGNVTLGEWITRFTADENNLDGDTFYINITVAMDAGLRANNAAGDLDAFTQPLVVTVDIPGKKPASISVHGSAANTVVLNPYDYYMYLVTGDDSYNPLPSSVDVTYETGVTESVSVFWRAFTEDEKVKGAIQTAGLHVSEWYVNTSNIKLLLENDETRYAFRWQRYEMAAQINSGVIRTMEFLVDGEWVTSVPKGVTDVTARVTFTSGHVMELPAVIRPSAAQANIGYAYIGYNVDVYQRTGALVDYEGCHLKQSRRITIG